MAPLFLLAPVWVGCVPVTCDPVVGDVVVGDEPPPAPVAAVWAAPPPMTPLTVSPGVKGPGVRVKKSQLLLESEEYSVQVAS